MAVSGMVRLILHRGGQQAHCTYNFRALIGRGLAAAGLDTLGRKRAVTGFCALAAASMLYMGLATVVQGSSGGVLAAFTSA